MAIPTTCIGSYPKPNYVPIRDWFQIEKGLTSAGAEVTRGYTNAMNLTDPETEALFVRATNEAIADQVTCGIDVPTDGEQRRENYIHYHCRNLNGVDFASLTTRVLRDGAYRADLPAISGKISPMGHHFLDRDFKIAQAAANCPIKITVPGPTTIMDTCANEFYGDERQLAFDLADALNFEIRGLADAGCHYIQVDEPLFARNVERSLNYGIECLERCFAGVPADVIRVMHMCCGYPEHLDDEAYHKADPNSYFQLAEAVDASSVNQVSIEDAHRHNDLALLEKFQKSIVILGCVAIGQSQLESVEEIANRLRMALEHIDRDRLMAAPDCGLAMLGRDLAMKKLKNLCDAAGTI